MAYSKLTVLVAIRPDKQCQNLYRLNGSFRPNIGVN